MTRHWIIRGFFIGLLILLAGGWITSYLRACDLAYWGQNIWLGELLWGKIRFVWMDENCRPDPPAHIGWNFIAIPASATADAARVGQFGEEYHLGFSFINAEGWKWLSIPLWFPTSICGVILWLVWRKTRSKPKGFPVDV